MKKIILCTALVAHSFCHAAEEWFSVGGEGKFTTSTAVCGTIVNWSVYKHYSSSPGIVSTSSYMGCDCIIYRDGVQIATVKATSADNTYVDTGTVAGQTCGYQVAAMGDITSVMYRTCYFSVNVSEISASNVVLNPDGSTVTVTVAGTQSTYNKGEDEVITEKMDWSISCSDWISASRSGDQLIIGAGEWVGSSTRTGVVKITVKGNVAATIDVKQETSLLPELAEGASEAEIIEVMSGFADEKIKANIADGSSYKDFYSWATSNSINHGDLRKSSFAWLSYALDTEKLIANAPVDGDVTIDTFENAATDGAFEFTVNVKDITVGDGALEANICKVFDIEGVEDLATGTFSADAVEVNAAAAEGGKVKFTVTPKGEDGAIGSSRPTAFFFKVRMK